MSALTSAELLRLRTVRSPRYAALAALALAALLAALEVSSPGFAKGGVAPRADSLRAFGYNGMVLVAVFAAQAAAAEFPRGTIALTYLVQPDRWRVTLARALTYGVLGGLLSALVAGVALAVGLGGAGLRDIPVGLSSPDVLQTVAGAAFGGASMAVAGVLVGTLVRNPTVATSTIATVIVLGGVLGVAGLQAYFPLGLLEPVLGLGHRLSVPAAILGLIAYPAVLALVVRFWAVHRDVT